jgi:hypothetical protein
MKDARVIIGRRRVRFGTWGEWLWEAKIRVGLLLVYKRRKYNQFNNEHIFS